MKTKLHFLFIVLACLAGTYRGTAQGTAFTYQARLNDNTGPVTGLYDVRFMVRDAPTNGNLVAGPLSISAGVTNGLFAATLDFGNGVFTGAARWLQLDVRTNGAPSFTSLLPLQPILPAPFAIMANTASNLLGTLPAAQLGGILATTQLPTAVVTNNATGLNLGGNFTGNGANLTNVNASALNGMTSASFWKTNGNTGADPAGGAFIGTADNLPLEIKVNGIRALRLEPRAGNMPNVIGGSPGNTAGASVVGAAIGGGANNSANGTNVTVGGGYYNSAAGTYATIPGGVFNYASGDRSVAGGSYNNATAFAATVSGGNLSTAGGYGSTVAGGENNTAGGGTTFASGHATVGGGYANSATNSFATVAGGALNLAGGTASSVGGGTNNLAYGAQAVVSGGLNNSAAGQSAAVGGGANNSASGNNVTVGGGFYNSAAGTYATIPGGVFNYASGDRSVAGGSYNNATAFAATVSGGNISTASGYGSTVAGGENNTAGGGNTFGGGHATVGGGYANSATNGFATVPGGANNIAGGTASSVGGGTNNLAYGAQAVVSGGLNNSAAGQSAAVGGGANNSASGTNVAVGGGFYNSAAGTYATIPGGVFNYASGDRSVAGGSYNNATAFAATVSGGNISTASGYGSTVAGGENNTAGGGTTFASGHATVGGGYANSATNSFATVPGGANNIAGGSGSFAAGRAAKALHDGAFVWADTSPFDFEPYSMSAGGFANSFNVRATGGIYFVTGVDASGNQSAGLFCAAGGGSFTAYSDRNAKENFSATDGREVLARVAAMPIETWNYKAQDPSIRHMGPMAQDFKAAFGLGETDKGITTIDADGVALAAIQGLNQKLDQKDAEIQELKARLEKLEKLIRVKNGRKS